MRPNRVEFHTLRYPPQLKYSRVLDQARMEDLYAQIDRLKHHSSKDEFIQWVTRNKTDLESPLFRAYYAARREKETEKRRLFYNLATISQHYSVSIGLLGGWLSTLNQARIRCEDTIRLAQMFLLETVILESTFSEVYSAELASKELSDWIDRNPRVEPCTSEDDKAFILNDSWAKHEDSEEFVNQARLRVTHGELSPQQINLKNNEIERLSQVDHDLDFDCARAFTIQEHIVEDANLGRKPPWSLEEIRLSIKKWDDTGRHLGWASQANLELQRTEELMSIVRQAAAQNTMGADEEISWEHHLVF